MELNIRLNFTHPAWLSCDSGYCRGSAFIGDAQVGKESLLRALPDADESIKDWNRAVNEVNGFFSIIKNSQDALVAVVDRVRSIPLFYGTREQILYLSDDAEWVREQIADKRIDPAAEQEFLMAGYVTGPDTLFPNLKQLQAGEMLHAKLVAGNLNISKQRYFRFSYSDPATHDESELRSLMSGAVKRSIRRLIDYAAGRQIVLPLSGGYDSRLIAMMLNRMQYENVFTFSYGSACNLDTKYSQLIASELCFPWQFIEYTPDKWRSAWQTDSCRSYRYHGSGWSSIPHLQDWLAVKELKNQKLVQNDCVFAPGHGAMSILEHLKGLPAAAAEAVLPQEIFQRKYVLSPAQKEQMRIVCDRLGAVLRLGGLQREPDLISAFSAFEWQERQCKFLVNSVRVYEHFDYDWWLPLWDMEFIDFWKNAPLKIRKDKGWYESFCDESFDSQTGKPKLTDPSRRSLRSLVGGSLSSGSTRKLLRVLIRRAIAPRLIDTQPFYAYSRFPREKAESLIKKGYSLNGINAFFFILELNSEAGSGHDSTEINV